MALKDITLGQFFPGTTFLHKLDPRTKILLVVFYIVALFCAKNIGGYALCALMLVVGAVSSKVGFKALFKGLKPIFMILIITGVLNLLYTVGEGEPLVSFWIFNIYWEGIRTAFFMVIRIMMLISCTFLLTYTTSPIRLTDAIEELLGPLKKLRMPVHELAMIMSIALRFIPLLIEETDKIMSAQKARGADFETGNLIQRAKSLIPLLVPLFISAFRRADELATAMECRCYHGGEGRTRMLQLKYVGRDYAALLLGLCLCAGVFGLNLLGVF
ncbi:MAG: energy-coupling factor transporter transmembrane protein EcfT [Oscillospiraceae bacterium]|nr:energy-coupling factor transporter transmembrane protein EcfT [Oscillospiraceae bacterium]